MIERKQKENIKDLLSYFPTVGVVGPRQVGKTTLVKALMEELPNESVYFDLELPSIYERLSQDPEWFLNQYVHKTVIIDEVQWMLGLFPVFRSLIDTNRKAGRFILLGSVSPAFLATSQETLAGRIAFEVLQPFGLNELPKETILPQQHWLRGGYPSAILAPTDALWWAWQRNFIQSYAERDLVQLGIGESPQTLYRILKMLANSQGSLFNISDLAKSLQIDQRKIKSYINLLEQAYLVRTLQPWHVNIPKRLVKSSKIFVRDSGNLHYLLDLNTYDTLIAHPAVGNSWEGYVIEQICNSLNDAVMPYFYRTANGAEIDLVLVKGIEPVVSIEIKLSTVQSLGKGSTEAIQDLKTIHNFVVTTVGGDYLLKPQWRVCNLAELHKHLQALNLAKP